MHAIRIHRNGGPDVLCYEDVPRPEPSPGHALVRVEAAGVNYIDRSGLYRTTLPVTLGQEGAGTVVDVGSRVTDVRPGDRVAWTGVQGSYAELVLVRDDRLVLVPAGLDTTQAAAAMLQGMTAQYLACSTFPLTRGHRCLVHAAAGGVGLLLVQLAKLRGAEVFGTVSTEAKARLARQAGVDHIIRYTEEEFDVAIRQLTGGDGVHVVYDSVGRTTFERSLNCLVPRGMLVLFGQSSGPVPPFDAQVLNRKGSLFLTRPSLGHYIATREQLMERASDVLGWIARSTLRLHIHAQYPLARAAHAHRDLESRQTMGKLLLVPG
jgi:NADPH2:quinone reductase